MNEFDDVFGASSSTADSPDDWIRYGVVEINKKTGQKRPYHSQFQNAEPGLGAVPNDKPGIIPSGLKLAGSSILQGIENIPGQIEKGVQLLSSPIAVARAEAYRLSNPVEAMQPGYQYKFNRQVLEDLKPKIGGLVPRIAPDENTPILGDPIRKIRETYQKQIGNFAEATSDLPTPVAAALYGGAEATAMALDPTNLAPIGVAKKLRGFQKEVSTIGTAIEKTPGILKLDPTADRELINEAYFSGNTISPGFGNKVDDAKFTAWLKKNGISLDQVARDGMDRQIDLGKQYLDLHEPKIGLNQYLDGAQNYKGQLPKPIVENSQAGFLKLGEPDVSPDLPTEKFRSQVFQEKPLKEKSQVWDKLMVQMDDAERPYIEAMKRVGAERDAEVFMNELRAVDHTAALPVTKYTRKWNPLISDWEKTGPPLTAVTDQLDNATRRELESVLAAQSQVEYADRVTAQNSKIDDLGRQKNVNLSDPDVPVSRTELPVKKIVDPVRTNEAIAYLSHADQSGLIKKLEPHLKAYRDWADRAFLQPLEGLGVISKEEANVIRASNQSYGFMKQVDAELKSKGIDIAAGDQATAPRFLKDRPRYLSQRASPVKERITGLTQDKKIEPILSASAVQAARIERFATRQLAKNEMYFHIKDNIETFPDFKITDDLTAPGTFIAFENGKKVAVQAPSDFLDVVDRIKPTQVSFVMKIVKSAAQLQRAGAVLSPHFPVMNVLRDQPNAALFSRHGMLPFYDTAKVLMDEAYSRVTGKGPTQAWQDFMNSAAGHSTFIKADSESMGQLLKESRMSTTSSGKLQLRIQHALNPVRVLGTVSNTMEAATRIAEQELARAGGRLEVPYVGLPIPGTKGMGHAPLGLTEAGLDASDVSLNFSRGGTVNKAINQAVPFYNVKWLDPSRFVKEFKKRPGVIAGRAAVYITLPALAEEWFHRNDEGYQNLPTWDKMLFYHVGKETDGFAEGWYHRIPKPLGVANMIFGWFPQLALRSIIKDDPRIAERAVAGMLNDTPAGTMFNQNGDGKLEVDPSQSFPPFIRGFTDLKFNQDWKGRPILDPHTEVLLPPREQYDETTSPTITKFSRSLPDIAPDFMQSPKQFEHLFDVQTAGLGRTALSGIDLITRKLSGQGASSGPVTPRDVPVLRNFLSPPPFGFGSEPVEMLYRLSDRATGAEQAIKKAIKEGRQDDAKALSGQYPEYILRENFDKAKKDMEDYRKLKTELRLSKVYSDDEKKDLGMQLDMKVSQDAGLMVFAYYDLLRKQQKQKTPTSNSFDDIFKGDEPEQNKNDNEFDEIFH